MRPPVAICLGGARSVWADLETAKLIVGDRPHLIVACNYSGLKYEGHLDAWVTLHPEFLKDWMKKREEAGLNADYRAFTHLAKRGVDAEILPYRWHASSGFYMPHVAFERLGCAGAILCGVPFDDTGGHIHWPGEWDHAYHYQKGLKAAVESGEPIRSMSGRTRELFGAPDADWLKSIHEVETQ